MTLYQRPDEHIFAEGARPGEVQPFPDLSRGWGIAFEQTGGIPPMEWFNFMGKRADEAIRYLMQRGLPEWSNTENYPQGAYIQHAGQSYRAKVDNKGKAPSNSFTEWEEWGLTRAMLEQHFVPSSQEQALAGTDHSTIMTPLRVSQAIAAFSNTVGQIVFVPSIQVPTGYLKCNGSILSRSDYPALWDYAQTSGALISETDWHQRYQGCFSCGDGTTTFRTPDVRGEFIRCWDDGRDVDHERAIGSAQEMQNAWHTHSASANAADDHTHSAQTDTQGLHGHTVHDPGHKHGFSHALTANLVSNYSNRMLDDPLIRGEGHYQETSTSGTGIWLSQEGNHSHHVSIDKAGSHSHTITVNGEGGNESRPRNIAWLAMIRY